MHKKDVPNTEFAEGGRKEGREERIDLTGNGR